MENSILTPQMTLTLYTHTHTQPWHFLNSHRQREPRLIHVAAMVTSCPTLLLVTFCETQTTSQLLWIAVIITAQRNGAPQLIHIVLGLAIAAVGSLLQRMKCTRPCTVSSRRHTLLHLAKDEGGREGGHTHHSKHGCWQ